MIFIMFFQFGHSRVEAVDRSDAHLHIELELLVVGFLCKLVLLELHRFVLQVFCELEESLDVVISPGIVDSHSKKMRVKLTYR